MYKITVGQMIILGFKTRREAINFLCFDLAFKHLFEAIAEGYQISKQ